MEDFQLVQQNSTSVQPPQDRKCPQCGSRSETIFQKEASLLTYILSFISLFVFQFWSIFTIPIIISATQQIAKRCYDCDTIIEKHDLFSLPSINDQILNFRFGQFACIVSRKYAYAILIIFIIFFTYFQLTKEPAPIIDEHSPQNQEINKTWIEYLKDCGSGVFQDNAVRVNSHYQQIYHQNIVTWEGIFLSCWDCPDNLQRMTRDYYLRIKMDPTDSDSETFDIILVVNHEANKNNIQVLQNLKQLEVVKFKGQFQTSGTDKSFHKLSLISIQQTGRKIENLSDIQTAVDIGVFD